MVAVSDKHPDGALTKALGHTFSTPELLTEALTHRSAAAAGKYSHGYERLEFLGDRVLGLVVADLLLEAYPEEPEGNLARRFTRLVRAETLEQVARSIKLGEYLIFSSTDMPTNDRATGAIHGDACEAVIGALCLDGGLDAARQFIVAQWKPLFDALGGAMRDAKTGLQEWAQARKLGLPEYNEVERSGPDHEPVFTIEVRVGNETPVRASGESKRIAEQRAAESMLAQINND